MLKGSEVSNLPGSYLDGGFQDSQCMSLIMIWQLHFSQSRTDEEALLWFQCQSDGQTASQYIALWSLISILKHWCEPKLEMRLNYKLHGSISIKFKF